MTIVRIPLQFVHLEQYYIAGQKLITAEVLPKSSDSLYVQFTLPRELPLTYHVVPLQNLATSGHISYSTQLIDK